MAYRRDNLLLYYKKVADFVRENYDPDTMTYAGFWRRHVFPRWPMSYNTFLKIINMKAEEYNAAKERTTRLNKQQKINI